MVTADDIHVTLRRSRASDAGPLSQLTRLGTITPCAPPSALFPWKTAADFMVLIERSVTCITAVSTISGRVVGCICLDDTPHVQSIPSDSWEWMLQQTDAHNANGGDAGVARIAPYNTLWIRSVLAPPSSAFHSGVPDPQDKRALDIERKLLLHSYSSEDLIGLLLNTALTNSPLTAHLLVPFPTGCSYPELERFSKNTVPLNNCKFKGSLLHIRSSQIVPQLALRLGIVEDYDDFVSDLLDGRGLITALPGEFYLDEILKYQDTYRKAIIAEDANSHRVVGLMCLEASIEDQQVISRQYATEAFGKLRPMWRRRSTAKGVTKGTNSDTPNVVRIYFFHIDPDYALCATQFLPFVFQEFPFVEYAMIVLPYDQEEPPFLQQFEGVPLRKYQPRNAKGDAVPPPEGLWITCRFAADPIRVVPVRSTADVERISEFLEEPLGEFSQQHVAALLDDIDVACGAINDAIQEKNKPTNSVAFGLIADTDEGNTQPIVGVASGRLLTVEEMYALRANYDLDTFVNYYTEKPLDYTETDISLSPEEGRRKFFRQEMRGILIRSFYVRAAYRCHVQFFVRELLRHTGCEVALVLEDNRSAPYAPLLRQLVHAPPRQVQEKRRVVMNWTANEPDKKTVDGKDVASLGCLFVATRRLLGDRKKLVHTRIIVVGASSTGLACIHRLLAVPYVTFTNIVLISTDGMPVHPNQQPYLWCVDRMELLEREHMGFIVGSPVRVVCGSVVDADTTQRYVSIDDDTYEPYDYLILTTGRQCVIPQSICRLHHPSHQISRGFVPQGTLALSGESAVEKLRQHLHDLDRNPQNISNILVYGSGLDAFAAVTSIVRLGFSPQRIVVVMPEVTNPFVDKDAFDCVVKMWNSLGTNTLRGYRVTRMEYDDDGTTLTTVVISPVPTHGEEGNAGPSGGVSSSVELGCSLIVCCEDKDIDGHILSTLTRRSIVFDGRVIVEANYRTTDKRVYAAGPVAMFTRRYGTTPNFDDFNARDVGTNLAEIILGIIGFEEYADPNLDSLDGKNEEMAAAHNELYTKVLEENGSRGKDFHIELGTLQKTEDAQRVVELQQKLPAYNSPLASRIRLPGDYLFFCCRCVDFDPSRCLRLCYSCIDDNKPIVTTTLDFSQVLTPITPCEPTKSPEQSLLVIYVDEQTHYIDAVVYFGNGEPELYHYMCLIGLPQSLLNLLYRYEEARIANTSEDNVDGTKSGGGLNLIEYLRLPKLQIIFFDRFITFYRELREKMRAQEEVIAMRARVLEDVNRESGISENNRKLYMQDLTAQRNAFTRQVQYELLKFLHESKDHLPQMMYLPDISAHVQQNAGTPS
ncbi:hypothetical protein DQ04_06871000 [Trypanosoma grayi]|uniref:hypothetical protein n=1 Tax=Trypanosoma grayi TaxID=71804 RepID=UPI0004F4B101|nr:hypothetical protein DQ04_06871000 [Trypanosoma grayi]KEG08579.1 hypothetical protein DQ04_06871000 [Trypanosoma grayi]